MVIWRIRGLCSKPVLLEYRYMSSDKLAFYKPEHILPLSGICIAEASTSLVIVTGIVRTVTLREVVVSLSRSWISIDTVLYFAAVMTDDEGIAPLMPSGPCIRIHITTITYIFFLNHNTFAYLENGSPDESRHPTNSRTHSLKSASVEASPHSFQQIFSEIVDKIPKIKEFTELIYENITRKMVHWLNFNAHTRVSCRLKFMMPISGGLSAPFHLGFTGFAGMYQGSHKEPDSFFRADSLPFPSIVNEAGSSESFPHLRNDKDLWMHGCAFVELVILLSWTKVSGNRIKGIIEVWRRNGAGGLSVTEMPILPRPVPPPASELIEFTRGQLFGPAAIAGQNPDTVLSLDVSRLRMIAEEVITLRMGLTPA
ncbi:hypothetical protein V8F44DRAFT_485783 [Aspergillus fumigatus]